MAGSRLLTPEEVAEREFLSSHISPSAFRYLSLAGKGANGAVFIAQCKLPGFPFPDKLYAVKMVYNLHHLSTTTRRNLYEAEFTLSSALMPSPFIVKYFCTFNGEVPKEALALLPSDVLVNLLRDEYGMPQESFRTIFGVFEGHVQTLLAWRKQFGPILPLQEFFWKGRQVVECEMAMLVRSLYHRDIKPDNYLVKADGTVCVADLGEAVLLVYCRLAICCCCV
jgi:serine/threonine protein kinase